MRVVQMNPFSTKPSSPRIYTPPSPSPPSKILDFKNFKTDDWILLGIIITLILEGSEDYILLCALGYLFIMGI